MKSPRRLGAALTLCLLGDGGNKKIDNFARIRLENK